MRKLIAVKKVIAMAGVVAALLSMGATTQAQAGVRLSGGMSVADMQPRTRDVGQAYQGEATTHVVGGSPTSAMVGEEGGARATTMMVGEEGGGKKDRPQRPSRKWK